MTTATMNEMKVRTAGAKPRAGAAAGAASGVRADVALALLRLALGAVFLAHGAQKLFVFGLDGVTEGFAAMGVPLPGIAGPAVALVETFGGLALVLGLLTPFVPLALAGVMLGAMLLVHLPAGFFLPNGIEFTLVLFAGTIAVALLGPGRYSLDALLEGRS